MMNSPAGEESAFLHELEVEVRTALTLAETSQLEDADGVPTVEWLLDPHAPRYEVSLRAILGAVQVLEDGYGLQRPGSAAGYAGG